MGHTLLMLTNHLQRYFKAVFGSGLLKNAAHVMLDCLFADEQCIGDRLFLSPVPSIL